MRGKGSLDLDSLHFLFQFSTLRDIAESSSQVSYDKGKESSIVAFPHPFFNGFSWNSSVSATYPPCRQYMALYSQETHYLKLSLVPWWRERNDVFFSFPLTLLQPLFFSLINPVCSTYDLFCISPLQGITPLCWVFPPSPLHRDGEVRNTKTPPRDPRTLYTVNNGWGGEGPFFPTQLLWHCLVHCICSENSAHKEIQLAPILYHFLKWKEGKQCKYVKVVQRCQSCSARPQDTRENSRGNIRTEEIKETSHPF